MARRVVSVLQRPPAALRSTDPALEANAYAVAEDVDLTVILRGDAVDFALAGGEARPGSIAGVALPPGAGGQDLRGLIESGVRVVADGSALTHRGIERASLVAGVEIVDRQQLTALLVDSEAVLTW
jgi:intracellular sulfur oxidation DsrE/DsrF family protein